MCRTFTRTEMGSYAVHKVGNEWEVIAPSDDPTTPAYWRVGVVRHGASRGPNKCCGMSSLVVNSDHNPQKSSGHARQSAVCRLRA